MSKISMIAVSKLALDLQNFRTVPQVDEVAAVRAMIAISPDMFWGLLDSLVEDGYLPTENIIVLDEKKGVHTVKEGNRRIAALKLLLGLIDAAAVGVTPNFSLKKQSLTPEWIFENSSVPCNVYGSADADLVDRIVTLTHGKGAKAGRDDWESIARARHNRKMGGKEVALDLLEQYLASGTNLTADQKDRWAGKYPLSVLDEAIKRIAPRCGYASSTALSTDFAKGSYRTSLEHIMHSIGANLLDFPTIRDEKHDFALRYGIPTIASPHPTAPSGLPTGPASAPAGSGQDATGSPTGRPVNPTTTTAPTPTPAPASSPGPRPPPAAVPMADERSMKRALKELKLHGPNRTKIESLRLEIGKLKIKDNPIAFCFLLRSIIELSAKAYCQDHSADGLDSYDKAKNKDKILAKLLGELTQHMTKNGADKIVEKSLQGAMTELGKADGILSITSMNALVHNPNFSVLPSEIPLIFHRIFPLLQNLNKI